MVNGSIIQPLSILAPSSPQPTMEEKTVVGLPVSLLWLPYVVLSVVLLSLMLISFWRFHVKHGHKYQRRRDELWRKLAKGHAESVQNQSYGEGTAPAPNGGIVVHHNYVYQHHMEGDILTTCRQPLIAHNHSPHAATAAQNHFTLPPRNSRLDPDEPFDFMNSPVTPRASFPLPAARSNTQDYEEFLQQPLLQTPQLPLDPPRTMSHAPKDSRWNTGMASEPVAHHSEACTPPHPSSSRHIHCGAPSHVRSPPPSNPTHCKPPSGGTSNSKSDKPSKQARKRRPLVFTSNTNGSMVDLRCGLQESMSTFNPKPLPLPTLRPGNSPSLAMAWEAIQSARPSRIFQHGLGSGEGCAADIEDDKLFLLQQTKL